MNIVTKNIFAAEVGREFMSPINVTADDGAPVAVGIIQHRPPADADVRRFHFAERAFAIVPLEIQAAFARFNHVNFLTRAFADVADENPPGRRVISHAVRTAQAETKKILQHVGFADEWIVVRNEIIRRDAVDRLARNRDG